MICFKMSNEYKGKEQQQELWHKDESNWIWGILYYNKKDARIFVPKRRKMMGWTINMAHPISVIAFFVVIALFLYSLSGF